MIGYAEYAEKIDSMKELFFTYKNNNTLLHDIDFSGKYFSLRSRKTIRNLKYSLRPDFTEFVRDFDFFDFTEYWRTKKTHNYLIFTGDDGRISFISADKKKFIEFWVYDGRDVILIDHYLTGGGYKLTSIGKVTFENDLVTDLTLMEIQKEYSLDVDFLLRTEQYSYTENKMIGEVTMYIYDSRKKMTKTVDADQTASFCCIPHNSIIYANPEIYKYEFTYNEKNAMTAAVCYNYFDPDKKAKLTVISKNENN